VVVGLYNSTQSVIVPCCWSRAVVGLDFVEDDGGVVRHRHGAAGVSNMPKTISELRAEL